MGLPLLAALEDATLVSDTENSGDVGLLEIEEQSQEVEQIGEELADAAAGVEALESLILAIEQVDDSKYGLEHARIANIALTSALMGAGVSSTAAKKLGDGLESYSGGRSLKNVALEESRNFVQKIWDAIVAGCKRFWEMVTNLWKRVISWFRGTEKQLEQLRSRYNKVKGKGVDVKLSDKRMTAIVASKDENIKDFIDVNKIGVEAAKGLAEFAKKAMSTGFALTFSDVYKPCAKYYDRLNSLSGKEVFGGAKLKVEGVNLKLVHASNDNANLFEEFSKVKLSLEKAPDGEELAITAANFDSQVGDFLDYAEIIFKESKACDQLINEAGRIFTGMEKMKLNFAPASVDGKIFHAGKFNRVVTFMASNPASVIVTHLAKCANAYLAAAEMCIKAAEKADK